MNSSELTAPRHSPELYEFGEFRLDPARRILCRRTGAQISLAPKVFDTLAYMVQRSGTVLDKDQLMQALWPNAVVEENNLNQHISMLRRILGETRGSHRYIATVPGRGYQFVAKVETTGKPTVRGAPTSLRSIAVLPFKPLVAAQRDPALEIGMADTLIAKLSGLGGIVVRSLGAVRRYAGADDEALEAGRELKVESVLEGNIQKQGSDLRVNARLMKVANGESLWAGTFDEPFTDIFAVQDAISQRVVAALSLHLSSEEQRTLTKRHTESAEAYQLYLKGRYYWWKTTPEEFRKCRDYFQRAVDADPSYALGYCGLNAFYGFGSAWGLLPPDEGWPRSLKANQKAFERDPDLPQAHSDLGAYRMVVERDWDAAEAAITRALALSPRAEEFHYLYSTFLGVRCRFQEALEQAHLALELDPLSLRLHQHLGTTFYYARRYEEAVERFEKILELDPDSASVHEALASALALLGRDSEALQARRSAVALQHDDEACRILDQNSAATYQAVTKLLAARQLERLQHQREQRQYVPEIEFLRAYVELDDRDRAIAALDKACAERNVFALLLNCDPFYDPLRKDRRFASILARNGLRASSAAYT